MSVVCSHNNTMVLWTIARTQLCNINCKFATPFCLKTTAKYNYYYKKEHHWRIEGGGGDKANILTSGQGQN